MSCSFVGFCKLLTPEWVSALSDFLGAIALIAGALIGEAIRRKVKAREDFERNERQELLITEAMYRIRLVAEAFEVAANALRDDLRTGNPPIGLLVGRIERALDRLSKLTFSDPEKSAFGPKRALELLNLSDMAHTETELPATIVGNLKARNGYEPTTDMDRQHMAIVIERFAEVNRLAMEVFNELSSEY